MLASQGAIVCTEIMWSSHSSYFQPWANWRWGYLMSLNTSWIALHQFTLPQEQSPEFHPPFRTSPTCECSHFLKKKARRSQLSGVDLKDYRISIQSLDRIVKNRRWKIERKKHRKTMLLPIDCHPMHTAHYTFGNSLTNSSWWLEGWAAKLNILILPSFLMCTRHHHDIDRAWVLLKHTWMQQIFYNW